jgi:DNA-binding response OmpR family regulator
MTQPLAGKRVLIVEDDNILAMNLVEELAAEGAKAIGPAGTVDGGLKAIKNADVDGAIVDINLGRNAAFPVADALAGAPRPVRISPL